MERYYPDFVKQVDEALKEATTFNKRYKHMFLPEPPPRRFFNTSPHGYLQIAIKKILADNAPEPVKLWDIAVNCGINTNSAFKCVQVLCRRGEIVRVQRGYYTIKGT